MNWEELKKTIYQENGSLRDIYIRNITHDDWKLWIDFVNTNYIISFEIAGTRKGNNIDFDTVTAYWQNPDQNCPSATIYLEEIIVKTYFLDETEIENDITPNDIKTPKNHESLLAYLKNISNLIGKQVELTEENYQDLKDVLMIVSGDQVFFPKR